MDDGMVVALMGSCHHLSFTNLPLTEWHDGVTLCRRKGKLYREILDRSRSYRLCKQCMKEMTL